MMGGGAVTWTDRSLDSDVSQTPPVYPFARAAGDVRDHRAADGLGAAVARAGGEDGRRRRVRHRDHLPGARWVEGGSFGGWGGGDVMGLVPPGHT